MAIKRPKPEEIVVKMRQVEVLMGQVMPRIVTIRQIGVTEQTYYRWKIGASQRHWFERDAQRMAEWAQNNSRSSSGSERERASSSGCVGHDAGQADPVRGRTGKLLSPSRRRACIDLVRSKIEGQSILCACRHCRCQHSHLFAGRFAISAISKSFGHDGFNLSNGVFAVKPTNLQPAAHPKSVDQ